MHLLWWVATMVQQIEDFFIHKNEDNFGGSINASA
jgi:hypothetical protein